MWDDAPFALVLTFCWEGDRLSSIGLCRDLVHLEPDGPITRPTIDILWSLGHVHINNLRLSRQLLLSSNFSLFHLLPDDKLSDHTGYLAGPLHVLVSSLPYSKGPSQYRNT